MKKGSKQTEEAKRKIGNASCGRIFSATHRKKISEAKKGVATNRGYKHSKEQLAKRSFDLGKI